MEKQENVSKYFHYHKPYRFVGRIPDNGSEGVKSLFKLLCEGIIEGIGCFGTSGVTCIGATGIQCDIRLFALRMDHNKKAHLMIEAVAERYKIPWLTELLLKHKPEDNLFIINENEVWAIRW